jgi:hypothetical protein
VAAKQKATQEPKKSYHIVNPSGAIHEVSREHAKSRLSQVGYRMATKAEVELYNEAQGNQRFDRPLCEPWSPEPDLEPEVD